MRTGQIEMKSPEGLSLRVYRGPVELYGKEIMERPQSTATNSDPLRRSPTGSAISLAYLFHIVTACALFFAFYRLSPLLALSLTVIIAPAIIRTHVASELYAKQRVPFPLQTRVKQFVGSIGVVLLTYALAFMAFITVSMMFGLFAVLLGSAMGMHELRVDSAVLGTAGGMVWGIAAAILATCFAAVKTWKPEITQDVSTVDGN